jgi:aminoglycoside 6-adenylyltransferase
VHVTAVTNTGAVEEWGVTTNEGLAEPTSLKEIEERFTAWAGGQQDVRAVLVVGSRARADHPADPFSDLDLVVIANDPARYLDAADWLGAMGTVWVTFLEATAVGGGRERRVLFAGGHDVDFAIFPTSLFRHLARLLWLRRLRPAHALVARDDRRRAEEALAAFGSVLRRGVRVLLDKDGAATQVVRAARDLPAPVAAPPSEPEFLEAVNDFWYHALWTAKKLRRGELWTAHGCLDGSMKDLVLRVLGWQARATWGADYDTWHDGRFLEEWAAPRAVAGLRDAYAHYDGDDMRRALAATMDLYRSVATDTAERLGYPYPTEADEHVTRLVTGLLARPRAT